MQKIAHYEIQEKLGEGGMGEVYLARDTKFPGGRLVALKVLPSRSATDEHFRTRFEREAGIIASLEHTAIVPVYDYGEEDGLPYLVMRYMAGGSLAARISEGGMALADAAKLISRIAPALDKAAERGIVHRDVKPENILFDEDGAAYVGDFGIAKLTASQKALRTSVFDQKLSRGSIFGTLPYMSPEQVEGKADVDGRSDQYSLGATLYEMLTKDHPFKANTDLAIALAHVKEPPPNILIARKDLPKETRSLIEKVLAKDPADRFRSSAEFAAKLQQIADRAGSKGARGPKHKPKYRPAPPTVKLTHEGSGESGVVGPAKESIFKIWWQRIPGRTKKISLGALFVLALLFLPGLKLPAYVTGSLGQRMALVPAGTFIMGSNLGSTDQRPVHDIFLDSYYIDVNEVTNDQYAAFLSDVGTRPYSGTLIALSNNVWRVELLSGSLPVVDVNWLDADAFCRWRGGRLPTEAEWEKAARGTDGRAFPWGNGFETNRGNFRDESFRVLPVGTFPQGASIYGVMDMSGNVWEWVNDWYDASYYSESPFENPIGPFDGLDKVRRGGSVVDSGSASILLRVSNRNAISPFYSDSVIGFRCAEPVTKIPILYWLKAD